MRSPDACSGDMYVTLPFSIPAWVSPLIDEPFTMPKSTSFTAPSYETRMFCGLMSRWTRFSGRPSGS